VAVSALMPTKLAIPQRSKSFNCKCAVIKLTMVTLGNEKSEIARKLQTTLKLCISQRHTNLSQVLLCLHSRTQDDSELFPRLSKGTIVKIIFCLIKCLSPSKKKFNLRRPTWNKTSLFCKFFRK
jgi:hypothetical protein